MANYEIKKPVEKNSGKIDQTVNQHSKMLDKQAPYSIESVALKQLKNKPGSGPDAGAHPLFLSKAADSIPTLARQALIMLKRQYGNSYVQRVIDLQRKEEN